MIEPGQARSDIVGLGELERRLWAAYGRAEDTFLPPRWRPWAVGVATLALVRAGRLRWHTSHAVYAVLAAVAAVCALLVSAWFLPVYLAALGAACACHGAYVREHAFLRTATLGLERYGFGVPALPLLVYGVMREHAAAPPPADGPPCAPLTRRNLASVIQLTKVGHELGEITSGLTEALRRWVFGGVAGAAVYVVSTPEQAAATVHRVRAAAEAHAGFAVLIVLAACVLAGVLHACCFGEATARRRRRRYLLVLHTVHEAWDAGDGASRGRTDPGQRLTAVRPPRRPVASGGVAGAGMGAG